MLHWQDDQEEIEMANEELKEWADGAGLALVKREEWNQVYRAARDAGTVEDLMEITVMPVVLEIMDDSEICDALLVVEQ